jgi:hypothetical protein
MPHMCLQPKKKPLGRGFNPCRGLYTKSTGGLLIDQ